MVAVNEWKRVSLPIFIVLVMVAILALSFGGLTSVNAELVEPHLLSAHVETASINGTNGPSVKTAFGAKSEWPLTRKIDQAVVGEKATYIVVLKDQPLARYGGGILGYAATSRQATGAAKLDARSPESVSYLDYLAGQRGVAIKSASGSIGRSLNIRYEYGATLVGFAAEMTAQEARQIATLDQVAFVEREKISYPQTDAGPIWAGAADVWGGDWNALSYKATLSGSNEVPSVVSTLSGVGEFSYNFYTNALSYTIKVENPNGVTLNGMHIHQAAAGSNGNIVHNLNLAATASGFTQMGNVTLSDADEAALVNGQLYVNVHSNDHPNGEVRGQIMLDGSLGEGVIVGIIDTGIDPWNPSFLATGGDGYVHTNPNGAGNYLGVCDAANSGGNGVVGYDATFPCNDKLIGVWGYTASDVSPRDKDGHGSHTAGTAAGNVVFNAVVEAPTETFTADISGVAPHANIIAYDGCIDSGGCLGSALTAARDQALLDGVDVINYSIGSSVPTGNLWEDSSAIQWLALREAGIFVATSNGNSGNGDATTGSPADLPWITSVGASSHSRSFLVTLTLTDTTNGSITLSGQAMTSGYGPAEVVFSNSITDTKETRLCAPSAFAPGTFNGEIVICERGEYGRVEKGQSVLDGGAGGFVLAQPAEKTGGPGSVSADTHELPAIHIDYPKYQLLRQFILTDSIGTVTGELSGATLDHDDAHGDVMATFSSRGPSGADADLIVPNLTAPGRGIWAAYHQGNGGDGSYTYNVIQGTSMSSPHVAGAGALLSALHPGWTPAEIESALMMTARDSVLDDDGQTVASPFAQGAGHIDVAQAGRSPLVMNVTDAEYKSADPTLDNNFFVKDLNIASFAEDECVGSCNWSRSFKNVTSETLTWTLSFNTPLSVTGTVSPTAFSLPPGGVQKIDIKLNTSDAIVNDEWRFGSLLIDETSGEYPDAHLPFAVTPSSGNVPQTLDIETQERSGTVEMKNLVTIDVTDLYTEVGGLVKADRTEFTLMQDNDIQVGFPAIFFDEVTTTRFISIVVPADSLSVIAEIVDTTSPDLDMLLFLDADNDGPELADVGELDKNENACQSASGGSMESCEIFSPVAGTYYVAIINFKQVTVGGDQVDLATAVVPNSGADAGNLTVSGPATVTGLTPYTLTIGYNDPSMTAIDKLYGYFTIGSDPGHAGNIAKVRVALDYLGVPDISIEPEALAVTREGGKASVTRTLTISTVNGVLDWNVNTSAGFENVKDGSFEAVDLIDPDWSGSDEAFCSPDICGPALATDGDGYVWFGPSPQTAFVRQGLTIQADDLANVSFDLLMVGPVTGTARMTVSIDGNVIETYSSADVSDFTAYPRISLDVSAYADGGAHTLAFDFENPGPSGFNMILDNVSLVSSPASDCHLIGDIPWLDMAPASGLLAPGSIDLIASFNSTGLAAGSYTDKLCVNSNDPDEPVINLPVALTVTGKAILNTAVPTPTVTSSADSAATLIVEVANSGNVLDTYDISLSGNVWPSASAVSSVAVDAFTTETVEITVMVPATATLGSSDTVLVTVMSQTDSGVTQSVSLRTIVKTYLSYLPLIFQK